MRCLYRCGPIQLYQTILELILQIPVGGAPELDLFSHSTLTSGLAMCILRLYAFYAQDRRVLIGLTLLSVALIFMGVVSDLISQISAVDADELGCSTSSPFPTPNRQPSTGMELHCAAP